MIKMNKIIKSDDKFFNPFQQTQVVVMDFTYNLTLLSQRRIIWNYMRIISF